MNRELEIEACLHQWRESLQNQYEKVKSTPQETIDMVLRSPSTYEVYKFRMDVCRKISAILDSLTPESTLQEQANALLQLNALPGIS